MNNTVLAVKQEPKGLIAAKTIFSKKRTNAMCHIVLLMPIFSLALFWILPFSEALPIYAAIFVVSGVNYLAILQAMKRRPQTGLASMIGHPAEVIERIDPVGSVRVDGEVWTAESTQILKRGDPAEIIAAEGLTLKVQKKHRNHISKEKTDSHPPRLTEVCHGKRPRMRNANR